MLLNITPTLGEIPRLDHDLLPPGAAQYCLDADLSRGDVRGLIARSAVHSNVGQTVTAMYVHPITGRWYTWNTAYTVDAVTGPIQDDQYSRFYFLDGANLRVARGDTGGSGASPTSYVAGVPKPDHAPTFNAYASSFPDGCDAYVFTPRCEPSQIQDSIGYSVTEETAGRSYLMTLTAVPPCMGATVGESGSTYLVSSATGIVELYPTPMSVYALSASENLTTGKLFILKADFTYAAVASVTLDVRIDADTTASRTFYKLSDGSYCTTSGATPLSASTAADARKFVIQMIINNASTFVDKVDLSLTDSVTLSVGGGNWAATVETVSSTQYRIRVNPGASVETRAYVYTYVNQWGEEGAPSDPLILQTTPSLNVTLNVYSASNGAYVPMDRLRLYRTNTGSSDTAYQFVAEYAKTSLGAWTTVTDTKQSSQLGEVISTVGYLPPPAGGTAIEVTANGVMVMSVGNEFWLSEPYLPYTMNPANSQTCANRIVGMRAVENSVFATTTGAPVILSGVSPDSMVMQTLPETQAGVSRMSIAKIGNKIAYLSNDGIVVAQGLDTTVGLSLKLFTRPLWRARYVGLLAQAHLAAHDGALVCVFGNAGQETQEGFVLRLDGEDGVFSRYSERAVALYNWDTADSLYMALSDDIYTYGGGTTNKLFTWRSKEFRLEAPHCFGALQIKGSGTLRVKVYANGTATPIGGTGVTYRDLVLTTTPTVIRLPANYVADYWSVEILAQSTDAVFKWAALATSPSEFRSV